MTSIKRDLVKSGEKALPFEKVTNDLQLHHHHHQQHKQSPDGTKKCQDASYCHEISVNSELCKIDKNIYVDCYASCSGCNKCKDDDMCILFTINQVLCQKSGKINELCKRSCNLCNEVYEDPLKGTFRNPF